MSRRKRVFLTIAASIGGLLLLLIVAAVVTIQTPWFANFVRQKVIASVEESTGGVVEIGSFDLDLWHLTVRVRNAVLHGTEPKNAAPLLQAKLLELKLKLFAGLKQAVDLRYLGIEQPRVNLMLLPDGSTNIPQPKSPQKPSDKSGLETIVNLAVNEFQINNGDIIVAEQKTLLNAHGENLRVMLNYNPLNTAYGGSVVIDPLILRSGTRPPLNVRASVPLTLEKDAVRVESAKLETPQSHIGLTASLQNVNAPMISAHVNAALSLTELERSFDLGMNPNSRGAPKEITAELAGNFNQKTNFVQVQTAHLVIGQTNVQASGRLEPGQQSIVEFKSNLALAELSKLFELSAVQPGGDLTANGRARLDHESRYSVDGTLNSRDLSIASGTTRISQIGLYSPFHADPFLISLDGLKVDALGGALNAKIFVEKLRNLSIEGRLRNFSLQVLTAAATGKQLGYDGSLDGTITARGDLKAKGNTGYRANANLAIVPGHHGVGVSGQLNAEYLGATGSLNLGDSFLQLPNSRLVLSGSLNRELDLDLVTHNLGDFLPAANFGSKQPVRNLPVVLQGGTAQITAQITGNLAKPNISAHLAATRFAVEQQPFDALALNVRASPAAASLENGRLSGQGINASFDGLAGLFNWELRPRSAISANLTLRNGDLAQVATLAGAKELQASGQLTSEVHIRGTYGDPLGTATVQAANGSVADQPFSKLLANVSLTDRLITLSQLELDAAGGQITGTASFQHPADSFTAGHGQIQLASKDLELAQIQAIAKENAGISGLISLNVSGGVDVKQIGGKSNVSVSSANANLSTRNLRVQKQAAGDIAAVVNTSNGSLHYNLDSNFAGSTVEVRGNTALTGDYATVAEASIKNLSVAKSLQLAGQGSVPATGDLSVNAHVAGTLHSPRVDLSLSLTRASVYEEPIKRLQGSLRYTDQLIDIPDMELSTPSGNITLTGTLNHAPNDFRSGSLALKVNSTPIDVGQIRHIQQLNRGISGTLQLAADVSGNLRDERGKPTVLFSRINADASASGLHMNGKAAGELRFRARTAGSVADFQFDSNLVESQIHGSGQAQLTGDYPLKANLSFGNIKYSNLAPLITPQPAAPPSFEARLDGQLSVNGPVLKPESLMGRLQLDHVTFQSNPAASPTGTPMTRAFALQNQGPIVLALSKEVVRVDQFRIAGRDTNVTMSGNLNLVNREQPLALVVDANMNLGLLEDIDRDFYSSGALSLHTAIRGTFAQPLANGRVELKNANVNYAAFPNGISNANGVILLNGTNASIENLTGQSGGGKITVAGFAGLGAGTPNFNFQAAATRVRVRYAGASITSDANISLVGNLNRSLLAGSVTVHRIAYASSSDVGSILSSASAPPSTPAAPSPVLSSMRLDVHILTAPDLQVVSTYANRLSILANLSLRGTAETPGMLGRLTVTDGQLVFFGNTYTVTTGIISFYNPGAIAPVLNISLETVAQGVSVTLGVSGPMNDLKLTYRSDPPLTFEEIVQLLATNTTPANPEIAAHQPVPTQQSLSQMGESALLGQAVANPLANRVQRVFGLSQFKIDPSLSGVSGQPSARVTLQEKIASNITFTYITDVNQANGQVIQIQWDLNSNLSAVGLRDYNGNVSIEVFYKFTKR